MTAPALVRKADLKRMADIAKSEGVTVWTEGPDGRKIGVSPDTLLVNRKEEIDDAEELRL